MVLFQHDGDSCQVCDRPDCLEVIVCILCSSPLRELGERICKPAVGTLLLLWLNVQRTAYAEVTAVPLCVKPANATLST